MKRTTYLLVFACLILCNIIVAQQKNTVDVQGKSIILPENIQDFTWRNFPKESASETGYYGWVQFYETPAQSVQDYFKQNNLELLEYISNSTYLFYFPKGTNPSLLRNKNVRSIVPVSWEVKVQEDLRNGDIPQYAKDGANILVTLQLYDNVEPSQVTADLTAQKIILLHTYKGYNIVEVSIPDNCLEALASQPYVKWIELISAPPVKEDIRGRSLHRSNTLDTQTSAGNNFTGDGIGVLVRDDGIVGPHIDFQGRIDNSNASGTGQSHGDGVAGIMAGAGNLDPTKRGMAAGANVFVSNYAPSFLDGATTGLINSGQVQITNSSYGDGCNGGYTTNSRNVDTQANNNLSLLHVFSAGNSGTSDCGYGAGSGWGNITGGHKQGKNVIATANTIYNGTLATSSSKGPARDGRIKPDITAHGNGHQSTNENNTYQGFSGTSGAAPGIAGVSAQLYQLYSEANGGTLPQAALIKAALLNTASDYGNVGPDFNYGWGLVNGGRAGKLLEDNRFLSDDITQGNANAHTISVPSGITQLRFMVYWNDPAAASGATTALINDLDLTVTTPSSGTLLPYVLDPTPNAANLNAPATNGVDRLNNMEQVVINTPAAGNYVVNVTGFDVPMGPQEYFVVYEMIEEELTLTYPNGGEKFVPGTTETIHWDAINTSSNFTLEYSVNNGGSWNTIGTVSGTTTNTDWNVPSQITGDALVRITSGSFQDVSDGNFSIASQPTGFQYTIVCPENANFSWNAVANAETYDVYLLGAETMEIAGTTSDTFLNVPIVNGEATLWAAIVAKNSTLGWESRRTIAITNTGLLNCDIANDVGIEILNSPSDFLLACSGGSEVTISVRLQNFGTQPQSNFTYSYQLDSGAVVEETYTATLSSGQNVTIDFGSPLPLSSNGNYTLNAAVNLAGDENGLNDTDALSFEATLEPTPLDLEQDFDTDGFLPPGWLLDNPDAGRTWVQSDNVLGSDGNPTTAVFVDGANYTTRGQLDTFTMEYVDLNGATGTSLSFDLAKAQWSASYNDRLEIEISTDCGTSFTTIYSKDGLNLATVPYTSSTWTPTSAANWRNETVSLAAYEDEIVLIRFININDYSNSTFIDNIKVEGTVGSNQPPVAVCQSVTVDAGSNCATDVANFEFDGGSSDPDGDTLTFSVSPAGPYPIGDTTVTLTVSDGSLTSQCTTTVTVTEAVAPVVICQDISVNIASNGFAVITAEAIDNGSNDACGDVMLSLDSTSFDCNDLGANTVTLTVTDESGNMASCTAIVTVTDTNTFCANVPTAVCQPVLLDAGTACEADADASDFDGGSTDPNGDPLTFSVSPEGPYAIGETTVVLTVSDGTNSSECTTTVTVSETVAPTVVCQDITVQLDANGSVSITAAAIDNGSLDSCGEVTLSIDVDTFTCDEIGDNTVTLTVEDESGNTATCTATVTVEDVSGPVFDQATLPQGVLVRNVDSGTGTYTLEDFTVGVTATDSCSDLPLLPITVSQDPVPGTEMNLGTFDITITAMDDSGNESDHGFQVRVEEALGVNDGTDLSNIQLYPNPASEIITLSNPQNIQLRDVQVFDLTGRLILKVNLSEALSETQINISALQSASYMLVISSEDASLTKQLIKE
ncbi:S8 family serine peptidase [Jejudonia soesokkakensis]|uniref:S8 family serine peptidase n=1 Tax=Jejudonia soesokkakensis TaxID=1323432 RepID=A0ABW2MVU5_9FLAO